jgi:hypothetical protein
MARSLRTLFFGGIARGRFLSVYFWGWKPSAGGNPFSEILPQHNNSRHTQETRDRAKQESYVINTLRFIGVLDSEGKKTAQANKAFSQQEDDKFSKSLPHLSRPHIRIYSRFTETAPGH